MLKQEISLERLEKANSRANGWQGIDSEAFMALNDRDICNFNYCSPSRRQIFLRLAKQLDGRTKELCASYMAFFAVVDTIRGRKGSEKALRRLQHIIKEGRKGNGKEEGGEDGLDRFGVMLVERLQVCSIDGEARDQIFLSLNKHLLNAINRPKLRNRLRSAAEIERYHRLEAMPWADGLLLLLNPRLSLRDMDQIARTLAYISQTTDDVADVYMDLRHGFVNFPKEDVLKYFEGLEIINDEIVGVDTERLNVKIEYLVSVLNKAWSVFNEMSGGLVDLKESADGERTKAIIDALTHLSHSYLDDAKQACFKHMELRNLMLLKAYWQSAQPGTS